MTNNSALISRSRKKTLREDDGTASIGSSTVIVSKVARRLIQNTGMLSPRPTNTEYYNPLSSLSASSQLAANVPEKYYQVLDQYSPIPRPETISKGKGFTVLDVNSLLATRHKKGLFSPDSLNNCELEEEPEESEDSLSSEEMTSSSPKTRGIMVLPPPPTHQQVQKVVVIPTTSLGYGSPESTTGLSVRKRAAMAATGSSMTPEDKLSELGISPFRVVIFARTRDEFVLATTSIGDRIFIYYNREKASVFRGVGCMFPTIPTDVVSETIVSSVDEVEELGAEWLSWSAGHSAEIAKVPYSDVVLGVMSASADVTGSASDGIHDDVLSRYFAVIYSTGATNESIATYIFAQSKAAEVELASASEDDGGIFARSNAVVPIVHSDTLEECDFSSCASFNSKVRDISFTIELSNATDSLKHIAETANRHFETIHLRISRMKMLIPECIRARQASSQLKATSYAAKLEEIIGSFWSELELELTAAARSANISAADIYVETRIALEPEAIATRLVSNGLVQRRRYVPEYAKAAAWGFPQELDTLDFSPLSEGECPAAPNSATASTVADTLQGYMVTAIEKARSSRGRR